MRKILLSMALALCTAGAMAQNYVYSATETNITASELNAKTEDTYISIKALTSNLNGYFTGTSTSSTFSNAAVFIWEPVGDGTFRIKNLNGDYMQDSNPKAWGTVDNAAEFVAVNATTSGSGSALFNGDGATNGYITSGTDENIVRFVKDGTTGTTWINLGAGAYNGGTGGWTIYYVYGVDVEAEATMTDEEKAAAKAEARAITTDQVGYPKSSAIENFCNAVDVATYATEVITLKNEMLANADNFVMPATDKVYALNSYMNYIYNNIDGSTSVKTNGTSTTDTKALWKFIAVEGGYNIQNIHTGLYINGSAMSETPGLFTLDVTAEENGTVNAQMGQFYLKVNGGSNCLHSTSENATEWSGAGLGNQYAFEEVSEFSHTLTVTEAGWATLALGFNATIPAEVTAYTIASEETGYVTLEAVEGVLGANVPVLVEATAGNYDFAYTTDAATVTESGLEGTLYNKDITANAYVLGYINEEDEEAKVGFGLATTEGKAEGTFTNNANKAYFVPTNAQANVASYSFRFGEGTTGVEEITDNREQSTVIYDLTGRRVAAITAPGIYIVNGVKRVIR